MKTFLMKLWTIVLISTMMTLNNGISTCLAQQNTVEPSTEIVHAPLEEVQAGQRLNIYVEIEDPKTVELVRVYFKTTDAAHYNFIPLDPSGEQDKSYYEKFKSIGSDFEGIAYSGVLPALANSSGTLEYLILVKNAENVVVKSQTYTATVLPANDQDEEEKAPITVYTEVADNLSTVEGFADNIVLDSVESTVKFGVVAGLYANANQSTAAASDGTTAINGGTVAASSGGFTTTSIVIGAAAAAAVLGGAIALSSGGGGGSGGEELTSETILGSWHFSETVTINVYGGYTYTYGGTWTFNDGGTFRTVVTEQPPGFSISGTTGTWSLSGNTLSTRNSAGITATGTVSGNSNSFTMTSADSTIDFSR